MKLSVKNIAFGAIACALALVVQLIAARVPTGKLFLLCLSGVFCAIALTRGGYATALMVYVAAAGLSFLIFSPNIILPAAFALLFGLYPVLKSLMERIRSAGRCALCKALYFALVFLLGALLYKSLFPVNFHPLAWLGILAAYGLAALAYDLCLTKIIFLYINKLARYIK